MTGHDGLDHEGMRGVSIPSQCPASGSHNSGPAIVPEAPERKPRDGVSEEVLAFAQKLFQLARQGHADELAEYVDAGVTPNLTNERGDTLLMLAAYNGQTGTVRALIDRGADVDRENDRGQTPLAGAVFKGYGEIVRILFDAGADPSQGRPTAIDAAYMFEKGAFIELFESPRSG